MDENELAIKRGGENVNLFLGKTLKIMFGLFPSTLLL
jgi:hypothetical protein